MIAHRALRIPTRRLPRHSAQRTAQPIWRLPNRPRGSVPIRSSFPSERTRSAPVCRHLTLAICARLEFSGRAFDARNFDSSQNLASESSSDDRKRDSSPAKGGLGMLLPWIVASEEDRQQGSESALSRSLGSSVAHVGIVRSYATRLKSHHIGVFGCLFERRTAVWTGGHFLNWLVDPDVRHIYTAPQRSVRVLPPAPKLHTRIVPSFWNVRNILDTLPILVPPFQQCARGRARFG